MYNFLNKHGQKAAFLLGVIVVLIFLALSFPHVDSYNFETMSDADTYKVDIFNFGLYAAIALTVFAAGALVIFGLIHIASNFKSSLPGLIGIAVILIMFFVFQSMSVSEYADHHVETQAAIDRYLQAAEGNVLPPEQLKFIGGLVRTGTVLTILTFVLWAVVPLVTPIINRIK